MASGSVDDVDLIDLESGVCGLNRASVPDATPEEQEHLLDVCPPKLEQKLSLTRRQNEEARRKIAESIGNDHQNVLVTLGHDQVVPQRKRIDVVSNDTIKRVRDITRNLAPVIGIGSPSLDRVDYPAAAEKSSPSKSPIKSRAGSIEESFEAREINDAFEFLSEHDDSAEIAAASSSSPPQQASASAFSYPLEPTCYIIEDREKYWSPGLDNEAFEISPTSRKQQQQEQQQQPTMRRNSSAFDLSDRLLAMGGQSVKRLRSLTYSAIGGDIADERRRKKFKGMMYRNSWNGSGGGGSGSSQGASRDLVSKRKKKNGVTKSSRKHLRRRSVGKLSGLSGSNPSGSSSSAACTGSSDSSYSSCSEVDWSWVEEVDCECNAGNDIGNIGIHQRSQDDEERQHQQQRVDEEEEKLVQVKGAKEEALEGSGVTTRQEEDSSSSSSCGLHRASPRTPTSKRMRESSCSSRSSGGITPPPPQPQPPTGRSSDSSNSSSNSGGSVAMSIAASSVQAKSADPSRVTTATNRSRLVASAGTLVHNNNNHHHNRHQRRRSSSNNNANDENNSSAVLDFTSSQDPEAIRLHNRNESSGGGTLPWLRASMRRLRQLRIPGTGSAASNNSSNNGNAAVNAIDSNGPNSLPDIALIAPEILAAQTNDTTGGLLRPSSAPAPNRSMESVLSSPTIDTSSTTTLAATSQAINAVSAVIGASSSPRRGRRSNAAAAAAAASVRCQASTGASASSSSNNNGTQTRVSLAESTSTCASSAGTTTISSGSRSSVSSAQVSPQRQSQQQQNPQRDQQQQQQQAGSPHRMGSTRRTCDRPGRDAERDDERGENEDEEENPLGKWPHALSPVFAYLGCTLGLFNISRFAILSTQFGLNFLLQFLLLSFVIGIPLFTLQVCLGQRLAAGAVDMWKISPLFQGVGIALLLAQAFIGIYSIVGVSWMFVYFRDSFITKQDRYRWAEPYPLYRDDIRPTTSGSISNPNTSSFNIRFTDPAVSYNLLETVPDYFNGVVLQRHHLNEPDPGVVTLKFQVAFNLAVVWMIVFVSLSKGLRSYGKVVYVFTLVPVFGTLVLCTKMLGLLPTNASVSLFFPSTVWQEFFTNGRSWVAAMSEVFLTWGLLGSAAMQIAAHHKHKTLYRDTSLVIIVTFLVLLLASFLANTCSNILKYHGYVYTSSSFERISVYSFMKPYNQIFTSDYNTPERLMPHASFLVGERVTKPNADLNYESGYQVLRLATELVPATLAALGAEQVSPFWAVLFYFILILFGIAQQLAIWHCVITGIMAINTKMMKLWETTITFFSCACAYILGLPMATEVRFHCLLQFEKFTNYEENN
uniref:Uncharacterized protein n=1 Tax=Trichogramma kaykai TaxID=54128 RepID=A0ABD2WKB0_9HYME